MNTTSASASASPAQPDASPRRVLVWDAPVRVFHWLLAASFIGAFLTAESERWRLVHVTLGYTVGGLVVFRVLWGLLGTRHARFADFVRGPRAVVAYLKSLFGGGAAGHPVGHNPAGAWAILGMLAGSALIVASGWASYQEIGGEWLEELHEGAANAVLALVFVHVAGVIVSSWRHHQNLVRSMIDGRQFGRPEDGIRSAWRSLAALMVVAVLGFWSWQWTQAPDPGPLAAQWQSDRQGRGHDADHDD
jgi:cytochrome b